MRTKIQEQKSRNKILKKNLGTKITKIEELQLQKLRNFFYKMGTKVKKSENKKLQKSRHKN
jgi:hypothetical protein